MTKLQLRLGTIAFTCILLILSHAHAEECEGLRFFSDRSPGTQVQSSSCPEHEFLPAGTKLKLAPAARLWLQVPASASSPAALQVICQNRAPSETAVRIVGLASPWLRLEGTARCTGWTNRRFQCDGAAGVGNVFVCAAATIKPAPEGAKRPELTTSVTVRGVPPVTSVSTPFPASAVIAALSKEAKLCRALYGGRQPIKLQWSVDSQGDAQDISGTGALNEGYGSCVRDVIKTYPYPIPNPGDPVTLSAKF